MPQPGLALWSVGYSDVRGQEVSDSFVSCRDRNEIQQDLPGATQSVVSLVGVMRRIQDAIQTGSGAGTLSLRAPTWEPPTIEREEFHSFRSTVWGVPESSPRKSPS